ncbi:transthyretin-like family protein [Gimesia fumaroli]|jgi:hypothetical protein|uniref:Carboxypeptidase regulatory-like domain-containing protein n=1 Tax=Gimesia fumaroli TaxID=2527976 RepID=A0A518IF70_9PLAN|nr:carboxypeptidase-like regulatory domain-containing protein [Gimesia fumaroli]QDV51736.1 hypothetical protein Enr17x_37940 [Gimesia fumaroli]
MSDFSISRWFPLMIILVGFTGCGSDNVKLASVSGTVTMNGEPLPGATVLFRPRTTDDDSEAKGAAESYGKTDEAGHYELAVVMTGNRGAVVGPNDVMISLDAFEEILPTYDSSGKDRRGPNPIPENYNSKTTLEFDVPSGGAENADFKLVNPDFKVPDQKAHSKHDVS